MLPPSSNLKWCHAHMLFFLFFYQIVKHENKLYFGFESCYYKKMIEESREMKLGASKIQEGNSKIWKSNDTSTKKYSNNIYLNKFWSFYVLLKLWSINNCWIFLGIMTNINLSSFIAFYMILTFSFGITK